MATSNVAFGTGEIGNTFCGHDYAKAGHPQPLVRFHAAIRLREPELGVLAQKLIERREWDLLAILLDGGGEVVVGPRTRELFRRSVMAMGQLYDMLAEEQDGDPPGQAGRPSFRIIREYGPGQPDGAIWFEMSTQFAITVDPSDLSDLSTKYDETVSNLLDTEKNRTVDPRIGKSAAARKALRAVLYQTVD